jgi:hypothetical protein
MPVKHFGLVLVVWVDRWSLVHDDELLVEVHNLKSIVADKFGFDEDPDCDSCSNLMHLVIFDLQLY